MAIHATESLPTPPPRSGHTLTSIDETLMVLFASRLRVRGAQRPMAIRRQQRLSRVEGNRHARRDATPTPSWPLRDSHSRKQNPHIWRRGFAEHRKDDFWVLEAADLLKLRPDSMKTRKKMWKKLSVEAKALTVGRSTERVPTDPAATSTCSGDGGRRCSSAEAYGLRFDGDLYQVELMLQL
uniref:Uncharacterized protein n=1 Tax=Ananas comosus var. bracteatus TaxID=296719 RepID=A0A6V7NX63_ANACO|nr:unnamed protein product [Ananas comosus var. bracteatus]